MNMTEGRYKSFSEFWPFYVAEHSQAAKRLGVTVIASASLLQGRIDPKAAIEFVRSTPGITTALIGMSRVEHVEENPGQDFRI